MRTWTGSAWYRDPWRIAVLALAVALIATLTALVVLLGGEGGTESAALGGAETPPSTSAIGDSSTITVTDDVQSTTGTESDLADSGVIHTNGLVAVKVDNAPGAKPQVGLADLPLLIDTRSKEKSHDSSQLPMRIGPGL